MLAFLNNLANLIYAIPAVLSLVLCQFLENLLRHLTSEEGELWLHTFCNHKHVFLNIISTVQQVIVRLILAASDDKNHLDLNNLEVTCSIENSKYSNFTVALRLISYCTNN